MTFKHKRRTLIVHKELQTALMIYMFGLAFMSSLTTAAAFQLVTISAFAENLAMAYVWIAVLSLGMVLAWTVLIMIFTNKIFGPLYRLHKEIRNWKNGEKVEVIKLRKGDHFSELIDDFNQIVTSKR